MGLAITQTHLPLTFAPILDIYKGKRGKKSDFLHFGFVRRKKVVPLHTNCDKTTF